MIGAELTEDVVSRMTCIPDPLDQRREETPQVSTIVNARVSEE